MRKFGRSIEMLQPACREWLLRTTGREPWFPGDNCDRRFRSPRDGDPVDVVLFGDFLKQIICSRRWFQASPDFRFRLWTLSEPVREVCTELIGIPAAAIATIPRYELFERGRRPRSFPRAGRKWTLVYSGRLSRSKNFDLLVRVASALQCEFGESVELVCFGDWDTWGTIEKPGTDFRRETLSLIQRLPWVSKPRFLGQWRADEWAGAKLENPVLANLSTFFMDDFGVSVAQAQGKGWPCILSEWGGHRDVIGNTLKIPVHLLGSAKDPESIRNGRAIAIARLITSRRVSRGVSRDSTGSGQWAIPSLNLGREDFECIRKDLRRRFGSGPFASQGSRIAEWFSNKTGRKFYDEYCNQFSGNSTAPSSDKRTVLVSPFGENFRWKSLNQIVPSLESAWAATEKPGHAVVGLDARASLGRIVSVLSNAGAVVFPLWTPQCAVVLRVLRASLGSQAKLLIHTHGEGTAAAFRFEKIRPFLRESDTFICASLAEARTIRLCYPRARIRILPFPIQIRHRRRVDRARTRRSQLLYVGRVSEQKNLHVLLLAIWILKMRHRTRPPVLHIYGSLDRLGSPNMGMRSKGYGRLLRSLVKRLGVQGTVRWHGFVERERLEKTTVAHDFVFISPSLHSDEDFGVAAFTFLTSGHRVVLSAWGGHLDFERNFAKQVTSVPVHASGWGPVLAPEELADAIEAASEPLGRVSRRREETGSSIRAAAERLSRLAAEQPIRSGPLVCSAEIEKLIQRRETEFADRSRFPSCKIYSGYNDPGAQVFFKAYGMTGDTLAKKTCKTGKSREEIPVLAPWVSIARAFVRIRDPHHGARIIDIPKPRTESDPGGAIQDIEGREYRLPIKIIDELIELGAAFWVSSGSEGHRRRSRRLELFRKSAKRPERSPRSVPLSR